MVGISWTAVLLSFAGVACASPAPSASRTRDALPGAWYQPADHPVYNLFRRESNGLRLGRRDPPAPTVSVGSSAWTAKYPATTPDNSQLPSAWLDALNSAIAENKIPNIPQSTESGANAPTYPNGLDGSTPQICSASTYACRIPGNIYDAPDGVMGIGFDDGPTQFSPPLYDFLQQNNQTATHYMIGINILNNWQIFLNATGNGDDIAVHTWTHPYMTTLDNLSVLAQLAWTMQIIYDSTGGKLPAYWRPPYGDTDNRVDAIASGILGLTAVLWNHDTDDWSVGETGGTNLDAIQANMQQWLAGPKSPGLIILEHELTTYTFQAFQAAWPLVHANGWNTISQLRMNNTMHPYQEGDDINDVAFASLLPSTTSTSTTATSNSTQGSGSTVTESGSNLRKTASAEGSRLGKLSRASAVLLSSLMLIGLPILL